MNETEMRTRLRELEFNFPADMAVRTSQDGSITVSPNLLDELRKPTSQMEIVCSRSERGRMVQVSHTELFDILGMKGIYEYGVTTQGDVATIRQLMDILSKPESDQDADHARTIFLTKMLAELLVPVPERGYILCAELIAEEFSRMIVPSADKKFDNHQPMARITAAYSLMEAYSRISGLGMKKGNEPDGSYSNAMIEALESMRARIETALLESIFYYTEQRYGSRELATHMRNEIFGGITMTNWTNAPLVAALEAIDKIDGRCNETSQPKDASGDLLGNLDPGENCNEGSDDIVKGTRMLLKSTAVYTGEMWTSCFMLLEDIGTEQALAAMIEGALNPNAAELRDNAIIKACFICIGEKLGLDGDILFSLLLMPDTVHMQEIDSMTRLRIEKFGMLMLNIHASLETTDEKRSNHFEQIVYELISSVVKESPAATEQAYSTLSLRLAKMAYCEPAAVRNARYELGLTQVANTIDTTNPDVVVMITGAMQKKQSTGPDGAVAEFISMPHLPRSPAPSYRTTQRTRTRGIMQ